MQAGFTHRFQSLTLCAYEVQASLIADLRNDAVMTGLGFDPAAPACDWRLDVAEGREPPSWRLADALRAAGAQGVLIPSHAVGAGPGDLNLVLWGWNAPDGAEVEVIDDHGRLPRPPDTA